MRVRVSTLVCAGFLFSAFVPPMCGYTFLENPPIYWSSATISMVLQMGYVENESGSLRDGSTSWDDVANRALLEWNAYLANIQFAATIGDPGNGSAHDGVNQAFFASSVYSQSFGSDVLAVAVRWSDSRRHFTESDVIFNSSVTWDSYRGNLRSASDLYRVALHEFGHTLGLDHPDEDGQSVPAIMNSHVSNLDALTSDDINGARFLYGETQVENQAPTVSITSPANGTVFMPPTAIFIEASAHDIDGTVRQVSFYEGSQIIGTDDNAPFGYTWSNVPAGNYILTAVATDDRGAIASSAPITVTVGFPNMCIPVPTGLRLWWTGDGNARDTVGTNHGLVFGRTTFVSAKAGQGFSFDGIDGGVRMNAVATAVVDNWTMGAWIFWKGMNGSASKEKQTILFNGNENNSGYGLIIPESGLCSTFSSLCAQVGKLVILYGGSRYIATGVTLDQNAWNYIWLSRENGTLKLYKNGSIAFSTATESPLIPSAVNGYFAVGTIPGYSFNGILDEIMVLNSALTEQQIRSLYYAGGFGVCKPLAFTQVTRNGTGPVRLILTTPAGKGVTLYRSSNLVNWVSFATIPTTQGSLQYNDAVPANAPSLFYKATAP